MKILITVAHPDDEVLGCGGTAARLAAEGHEVYGLILGEGVTSRYGQRPEAPSAELSRLKQDAAAAAAILGIKKLYYRDFPDNSFDSVPLLQIVKAIEEVKEELQPDAVYTHHRGDLNVDHRQTFWAVLAACRPLPGETVREIYSCEVASATEWSSPDAQNCFMPNVFVDISATIDKKVAAMQAYKQEIRDFPHPRSAEALRAIARKWGSTAGCEAAEAFELVRLVK